MVVTTQMTLENEVVLDYRIRESLSVINESVKKAGSMPLILNFSGGKDSSILLDLVQKVTDNFVCFYMVSGIDFAESLVFARKTCEAYGHELSCSYPSDYKGGFFSRLPIIGYFPTVQSNTLWCNRDLKVRPQRKVLTKTFGRTQLFKLNGVRRAESSRRMRIHSSPQFMVKDYHVGNDIMVFPILKWTNENVREYLQRERIRIKPNPLYKIYGVSGCYWCPFYQPTIYKRILAQNSNLLNRFIEWERKLNTPSVNGLRWLRDIKEAVCKYNST